MPVELEHRRDLLVEVERVGLDDGYLLGIQLREHELVLYLLVLFLYLLVLLLNPLVLLLNPLVLLGQRDPMGLDLLPFLFGVSSDDLTARCKKDEANDNDDCDGDKHDSAAPLERLQDADVCVFGGSFDGAKSCV